MDIGQFLNGLTLRPGAGEADIVDEERRLGLRLPEDYVAFLRVSDGAEGFIGDNSYVILWSSKELSSMNDAYEVQKYVPGLLIIGSSGGGEAYGFDTRGSAWPIVQVPFVGMDWGDAQLMGESFSLFLHCLREAE